MDEDELRLAGEGKPTIDRIDVAAFDSQEKPGVGEADGTSFRQRRRGRPISGIILPSLGSRTSNLTSD